MDAGAPPADPDYPDNAPGAWALRDLLSAVTLSFDRKKLLTGAAGLFLSAFVFGTVRWLGLLTGEEGAIRVFSILGLILASCVWVVFSGVIAKMSLVELLERRPAGTEEIRRFLAERWTTLVGTPVAFGALSLALLAVMAAIQLVGKIPGLGPIIFASSFLLAFTLAFGAALTALVHAMGAFLYPSIVALRGGGAVGVVTEMFDLVRKHGVLIVIYEAVAGLLGLVMTTLIGIVVWAGLYIVNWSALAIMNEKFRLSLAGIPSFFRVFLRPFQPWLPLIPGPLPVAWHYDLSGFLLGFSLLWIVIATAVYPFVFFNAAGSITYLILRQGSEGPGSEG
ncbi:MAG TPA: hypothetical protein VNI57_08570 [Candidatus Saccharimonadales bacterium]|nr:hypothetical protein [Candidatus Saccharimonadales bacterium]